MTREGQIQALCDDNWLVTLKKMPPGIPFIAFEKRIWQDKWVCELSCFRRVVGRGPYRPGVVGVGDSSLEAVRHCVYQVSKCMSNEKN